MPSLSLPLLASLISIAKLAAGGALLAFLLWRDIRGTLTRRALFFAAAAAVAMPMLQSGVSTVLQYALWSSDSLSRLLLPPHQPLGGFLFYAFTQFWFDNLLTLLLGGLLTGFFLAIHVIFGKRIFYDEEFALMFIAFAVVPWPTSAVEAAALVALILFGSLAHPNGRTSARRLWIPVALALFCASIVLNNALWFLKLIR